MIKKWEILSQLSVKNNDKIEEDIFKIILTNRGITGKKEIEEFLHPTLALVTIETVGIDKRQLAKALKRIRKAIENKEQIIVYGDYDVDGITGTAILWETLHKHTPFVMPYIPHRVDEGYGLSLKGIESLKKEFPTTSLIITVDNGIVANEAVDAANTQGIDVIITDHHVSHGGENHGLPKAHAIVHTTNLCGAGVAYLIAKEMALPLSGSPKNETKKEKELLFDEDDSYLELATLGTIADLVPLTGANRAIVKHGLIKLCQTTRPGLLAMFKEAALDNSSLGVYEIGHIIGPRLNAAGRLESAMDSLRLLCTHDPARAEQLAMYLGKTNRERQLITKESATHAVMSLKAQTDGLKKVLFVTGDYKEGVIGLVAGRLVEEFYRPTIVVSVGVEKSKGSVRSITGFNVIEFLRAKEALFINLGGHPMAAGFSVETAKLAVIQKELETMAETSVDENLLSRTVKIDCELPLRGVTDFLYRSLQAFAPFGMGNPEPVFASREVEIVDMRVLGKDRTHLKLVVRTNDRLAPLEAIAFGMAEKRENLAIGDHIDIAYTIDENVWNGTRKLQLKIRDIKVTD